MYQPRELIMSKKGCPSLQQEEHHLLKLPFKQHSHEVRSATLRKYTLQLPNQHEKRVPRKERIPSRLKEEHFSIDYSPHSCFLKKLRAKGEITKKCSRSVALKRLITSHKTVSPTRCKTPMTKDASTDVPRFDETRPQIQKCCIDKSVSTEDIITEISPRTTRQLSTHFGPTTVLQSKQCSSAVPQHLPPGFDILCGLHVNKLQGRRICPQNTLQEVKDFRIAHWVECHAEQNSIAASLPNHICTHKYMLNDRMLVHPTCSNMQGNSLCSQCGLSSSENNQARHDLVLDPSKKVTLTIPDPYKSQPVLRSTVESRNKTVTISSVPTLSYVPHAPQRVARHLCSKPVLNIKNSKKVMTHTINCKACATAITNLS